MTKQQLADMAGVSVKTLLRWCKPYQRDLDAMGVPRNAHVLPPKAVKFICDKFCIE